MDLKKNLVEEAVLKSLEKLWEKTKNKMKVREKMSECFYTKKGLKSRSTQIFFFSIVH